MSKYIVAVDDGHGIDTPGKQTPDGYKENNFNHYTKEYLIEELEYNGFTVVDCSPTRDDNSLRSRTDAANAANADIFVSIHYNAFLGKWGDWGGIETYHYPSSTKGNKLADLIHDELLKGTEMRDRKVKEANFFVLRETAMPAVLVECGFMDNKREALLMTMKKYRQECSREIAAGICKYFGIDYRVKETQPKYYVQAGAFTNKTAAENMQAILKARGFDSIIKIWQG